MLIIGFLLILASAAVIAYLVLATAGMPAVEISYGVLNVEVPPLWLFLSGVLALAVAAIGVWMVATGARSKARKAKEVRELRRQAKNADRRASRATDASALDQRAPVTGRATDRPTGTTAPPPTAGGYGARPGTPPAAPERNRLEPDR